jgi:excisionase family DNA binding protein
MTIHEAAEHLRLNPATVRRLARNGEIPAVKVDRQWQIERAVLDRWIRERSLNDASGSTVP